MVPQNYVNQTIALGSDVFSNVRELSIQLQIADEIYRAACRQIGIPEAVMTLSALDQSAGTLEVKGLKIPVIVTKEILENVTHIKDKWVTPAIGSQQAADNPWIELFDNTLKGIGNIDPAALPDHIKDSVKFRLSNIT